MQKANWISPAMASEVMVAIKAIELLIRRKFQPGVKMTYEVITKLLLEVKEQFSTVYKTEASSVFVRSRFKGSKERMMFSIHVKQTDVGYLMVGFFIEPSTIGSEVVVCNVSMVVFDVQVDELTDRFELLPVDVVNTELVGEYLVAGLGRLYNALGSYVLSTSIVAKALGGQEEEG